MNGLADVDGFKIYVQVCLRLGFPPLTMAQNDFLAATSLKQSHGEYLFQVCDKQDCCLQFKIILHLKMLLVPDTGREIWTPNALSTLSW